MASRELCDRLKIWSSHRLKLPEWRSRYKRKRGPQPLQKPRGAANLQSTKNLDFSRLRSLRNQIRMRSLVPRERNKKLLAVDRNNWWCRSRFNSGKSQALCQRILNNSLEKLYQLMKSSCDHCSFERNLSNCVEKHETFGLQRGSNPRLSDVSATL